VEKTMANFLLHHPWVQFYLLYVAILFVAFVWDYLRHPRAIQDGSRTRLNLIAYGAPDHFQRAVSKKLAGSVFRPGQRTE
jgi:hypothetical protein